MNNELTKSDIKKIEEEIEYRKLVVRKEALEAVKEARAHGDLSENFEYHAALLIPFALVVIYLERLVKTAQIVDDSSKDDEVGINNTVVLYFEDDDETDEFRLVTSIRGDIMRNMISIESPLGKALLGKKEGERVYIESETGDGYYVVIKKLINTNDDSQDKIQSF